MAVVRRSPATSTSLNTRVKYGWMPSEPLPEPLPDRSVVTGPRSVVAGTRAVVAGPVPSSPVPSPPVPAPSVVDASLDESPLSLPHPDRATQRPKTSPADRITEGVPALPKPRRVTWSEEAQAAWNSGPPVADAEAPGE